MNARKGAEVSATDRDTLLITTNLPFSLFIYLLTNLQILILKLNESSFRACLPTPFLSLV